MATEWVLATTLGVDAASIRSALAEELRELVGLFDREGRLVGANQNLSDALGYPGERLLGMSALDMIAPDHRDRAGIILSLSAEQGSVAGAAPFDLVRADGSLLRVQVTGTDVNVGDQRMLAVIGRVGDETTAIGLVLDRLLANQDLSLVLAPLVDLFAWRPAGSGVAITWTVDGVRESISTTLPDPLTGMGDLDPDGPWSRSLELDEPVLGPVAEILDTEGRRLAREHGFGQVWVEPVATIGDTPDATITVFTAEGGYSPLVHRYGVDEARRYLQVVLRWSDGFRRLNDAARSDDLTGLANRRSFFSTLNTSPGGGAILFADLDGFKVVNDRWGHAAGDAVLAEVGRRIVASVDPGACSALLGGDEFAVILGGATVETALDNADRIRKACAEPFHVNGQAITLGISIGVAHDPADLSAAALQAADSDQYADKRRRNTDS